MFNEIYKGIVKLFNQDDDEKEKKGKIPHFLSIVYGFDPLKIANVVTIDTKDTTIPNIVLVLAGTPEENFNIKYADTIVMNGKLTPIILFNLDAYMCEDKVVKLTSLVWSIWRTAIRVAVDLRVYLDENLVECANLSNMVFYAPLLIGVKALDKLTPGEFTDAQIAAAFANMYKKMVYPETIRSARKLLSDTTLEDVLDNSLWLGVSNDVYPYIRFDDIPEQDDESNEDI